MFGKRQNLEFQRLEKAKFRSPMFGKEKLGIPMFRKKGKLWNSNVWKRQTLEFQCLKKATLRIPMLEKAKF